MSGAQTQFSQNYLDDSLECASGIKRAKNSSYCFKGEKRAKKYILEHYFSGGPDPAYLGEALLVLACFQEPCLGFLILALRGCA